MSLKTFFAKNLNTDENSTSIDLRPHYYINDYQTIKKRIVARNNNNIITIDNEYIPISIIRDIYK